jgi:hypothetical protein
MTPARRTCRASGGHSACECAARPAMGGRDRGSQRYEPHPPSPLTCVIPKSPRRRTGGFRRNEIPQEPSGTLRSPTIPWSATADLPNRPIPPLTSEWTKESPAFGGALGQVRATPGPGIAAALLSRMALLICTDFLLVPLLPFRASAFARLLRAGHACGLGSRETWGQPGRRDISASTDRVPDRKR